MIMMGGVPYTLPVKTVDSDTQLTLVSNFTGPTQSGAAWSAVPRVALNMVLLVDELRQRGIHFKSLTDSIDTSSPMGRFIFHIMSALAEMERELIVERTRAGLAAAREKGRIGGRRPKLTEEQWAQAGRLIANGVDRKQVAIIYDVAVCTLYKKFPADQTT